MTAADVEAGHQEAVLRRLLARAAAGEIRLPVQRQLGRPGRARRTPRARIQLAAGEYALRKQLVLRGGVVLEAAPGSAGKVVISATGAFR